MRVATQDWRELVGFIEQLPGVRSALPPAIGELLDWFMQDEGPRPIDNQSLHRIVAAFEALPADVRSRVLNGWTIPAGWSRAEQNGLNECDTLSPFLTLAIGRHDPQIDAAHVAEFSRQSNSPVRLIIETGTSKSAAIAAARSLAALLEDRWDELLQVDEWGRTFDTNKSGRSQTPDAVQPTSTSSERKALTTAA